jgi:deoxyribodipyrimidine photo-lyase
MKKYTHALHLFRRDLRLIDNTALNAAAGAQSVSVGYVFDSADYTPHSLRYLSTAVIELAKSCARHEGMLNIWAGTTAKVLATVLKHEAIDAVYMNVSSAGHLTEQEQALQSVCAEHNVAFIPCDDALLTTPAAVRTGQGAAFKIFTPFYRVAVQVPVRKPVELQSISWHKKLLHAAHETLPEKIEKLSQPPQEQHALPAGRKAALASLRHAVTLTQYQKRRDMPADEKGSSQLSAHLAWGAVSVREVYHALTQELGAAAAPLVRSLYWRDFFGHIALEQPRVYREPFLTVYKNLHWENDEKKFEAWKSGKTGFPIVDAGMRQLNETGYMHNRVRMITASFLIKDLHIDWQWGESYFAEKLVDYDPAVNNGNWQWCASTGCDSQPYFRIFNPWLQQQKFDPDAVYCKRWVSELSRATAEQIHAAYKKPIAGYVRPMIDHAIEAKKALAYYKACK